MRKGDFDNSHFCLDRLRIASASELRSRNVRLKPNLRQNRFRLLKPLA